MMYRRKMFAFDFGKSVNHNLFSLLHNSIYLKSIFIGKISYYTNNLKCFIIYFL